MVRRLELAQALVSAPRLLVLDEPTVGLDPLARETVWEHVQRLRAELVRHGKPHEIVIYPGADHSFMVPEGWHVPDRDNPPGVAEDAWARIRAFFAAHLRDERTTPPSASPVRER